MAENTKSRFYYLDAFKFFSMLIVFLCHLRMAFFYDKLGSIKLGKVILPNYIFSGNLAVCMFLLISVFIYARKAFKTELKSYNFFEICIKRYIRLVVPAIFVNALIFLFYSAHLFFNIDAFDDSVPYVNSWFNFGTTIKAFCKMLWADFNTCWFESGINPQL